VSATATLSRTITSGSSRLSRRDIDDAMAHFREALAVRPNHVAALNNLGRAMIDQGKPTSLVAWHNACPV